MPKLSILPAIALLAILTACSDTPTATVPKKEPGKVEPVTGQSAIFKMYQMARFLGAGCAGDEDAEHAAQRGQGRPSRHRSRLAGHLRFCGQEPARAATRFSIVEGEGNLHKGAFAGPEARLERLNRRGAFVRS